jgi:hypothetical protein
VEFRRIVVQPAAVAAAEAGAPPEPESPAMLAAAGSAPDVADGAMPRNAPPATDHAATN